MNKYTFKPEKAITIGDIVKAKPGVSLGGTLLIGETAKCISIQSREDKTQDNKWIFDRVTVGWEIIKSGNAPSVGIQFADYHESNWRLIQ